MMMVDVDVGLLWNVEMAFGVLVAVFFGGQHGVALMECATPDRSD